ncbi:MAG: magnesium transporter, partial [Pseudonocardiaceae bacterium]
VILLGPVIGLIAILHHELLRGVGRVVGAALLNVVVLSALAALHTLVMVWVFDPARNISVLAEMLLAGMITLVMLLVSRPVRRMWQMMELSVGAVGGALPAAPPGVLARLRRRAGAESTPSERFWEEARGTDADQGVSAGDPASGSRVRPESGVPVVIVAERLDRPGGGTAATPVLGPSRPSGPSGPSGPGQGDETAPGKPDEVASRPVQAAALPAGFSSTANDGIRIADLLPPATNPVMAPVRDRAGEEPVYVPSASGSVRAPRQAELEEVAGRPVWVVYRPSAGLEVGVDGTDGDTVRVKD